MPQNYKIIFKNKRIKPSVFNIYLEIFLFKWQVKSGQKPLNCIFQNPLNENAAVFISKQSGKEADCSIICPIFE
jgi:hypothetical protein